MPSRRSSACQDGVALSYGNDSTSADVDQSIHPSFEEALRLELLDALDKWEPPAGARPTIVGVGIHVLEAIRQMAYLARPDRESLSRGMFPGVRHEWRGIWNAITEDAVIERLAELDLASASAVVLPAVMPETGNRIDLEAVSAVLTRNKFAGRLILDWSDALHLNPLQALEVGRRHCRHGVRLIVDPARVLPGARQCRVANGDCLNALNRLAQTITEEISVRPEPLPPDSPGRRATHTPSMGRRQLKQDHAAGSETARSVCDWEADMAQHRRTLLQRLADAASAVNSLSSDAPGHAPHILAVHFPGVDHLALVERLWRDFAILASYLGPFHAVRFQVNDALSDDSFLEASAAIRQLLPACRMATPDNGATLAAPGTTTTNDAVEQRNRSERAGVRLNVLPRH
jgi:hypothetical protein